MSNSSATLLKLYEAGLLVPMIQQKQLETVCISVFALAYSSVLHRNLLDADCRTYSI